MRSGKRNHDQLRPITIHPRYVRNSPGSCMIRQGDTRVVATATYTGKVPFFIKEAGSRKGWITGEYAMLPGSTGNRRVRRDRNTVNKRHVEIQRFISRGLRALMDLKHLGQRTITLDCDVIQADGGTRCASFNAAFCALVECLDHLVYEHLIKAFPPLTYAAAVSKGIQGDTILVDLDYREDADVDADINIISSESGDLIEVQGLVEGAPISPHLFQKAVEAGVSKNLEIIQLIKQSMER